MIDDSFHSTALRFGKKEAPTILTLVQIIVATVGTSTFAERSFSLDRRLKSYLRSGMKYDMFDALVLMGWYKDDLDEMLELAHIDNDYINDCKDDSRSKRYGKNYIERFFK